MNIHPSQNAKKTFIVDSTQYVIPGNPPALHIMNTQTYEESIIHTVKNNILFQPDKVDNDNDSVDLPFQYTTSKPLNITETFRTSQSFDWFFISFFSLFVILSLIKIQSHKTFNLSLRGAINKKYASALSREGDFFKSSTSILIFIYSCYGIALMLYAFTSSYMNIKVEPLKILLIFLLVTVYILCKLMLFSFTAVLFNIKPLVSRYIQQIILIDFYVAVFIFPLAFIYNYFPLKGIALFSIVVLSIIFIFRIIRGFLIFSAKFFIYENFLYFCTLEILPLLLSIKFSINYL